MPTLNQTQTLAALSCTFTQLLLLMRNPAFPPALSNDGYGHVTFDQTAIMASAASRGWTWGNSDLAAANWSMLASSSPCGVERRRSV